MAEQSPIPSPATSPSSLKRLITDTVTPSLSPSQTPTLILSLPPPPPEVGLSVLEVGPSILEDETQNSQSPKKPKFEPLSPSLTEDVLQDSELKKMLSPGVKDEFTLSELENNDPEFGLFDEFHHVSAKFSGFYGMCERQDSENFCGIKLVGMDLNEVSEVELEKINECFEAKDEFLQVSTKFLGFDGKCEHQDSGNLSAIEQVDMDLNEDSEVELEKKNEGFEEKVEFLGIKDENPVEIAFSEKKAENFGRFLQKSVKSEELASSVKIEVIDGTLILDVEGTDVDDDLMVEGKRNQRRGKKGNAKNAEGCVAGGSSGGGSRKNVYSRKDMEGMRYVNSKGQKKFWNEIYSGFLDAVKEEYDGLGSFKQHQTGGGKNNCSNGGFMGNLSNRDILGMPAASGRCYNPNIFVYRKKIAANCQSLIS